MVIVVGAVAEAAADLPTQVTAVLAVASIVAVEIVDVEDSIAVVEIVDVGAMIVDVEIVDVGATITEVDVDAVVLVMLLEVKVEVKAEMLLNKLSGHPFLSMVLFHPFMIRSTDS